MRDRAAGGDGAGVVGRADGAELDVGVDDLGVGGVGLNVGGGTRAGGAGTTSNTGSGGISGGGVVRVEPEHVDGVVVPDGQDEDYSASERLSHRGQSTLLLEGVGVTEDALLLSAESLRDGVEGVDAGDVDDRVLDDDVVLDVDAADLREGAGVGAVSGEELSDGGDLLSGVDGEAGAGAVEGGVTHAVGVEVASSRVAHATRAVSASALGLTDDVARVRGVGLGDRVSFPDIHLVAAGSPVTLARVGRVGVGGPTSNVGLEEGR